MTFFQAIQTGFRKYADFTGRASRPEFWWWVLFTTVVSTVLSSIPALTIRFPDGAMVVGPTLGGAWALAVLLPGLAVNVRRLRDAGFGWGHLFWLLIPLAGIIIIAVLCSQPSRGSLPAQPPAAPSIPQSA
jgi:uncharacterized membrane protein YhaH (DUF805 family)